MNVSEKQNKEVLYFETKKAKRLKYVSYFNLSSYDTVVQTRNIVPHEMIIHKHELLCVHIHAISCFPFIPQFICYQQDHDYDGTGCFGKLFCR